MKTPPRQRLALMLAVCCLAAVPVLRAQDTTRPYVAKPINDRTVAAGSPPTTIKLKKTFGLTGVTGPLVRFSTTVGDIDVELFPDATPLTVTAFLQYAEAAGDNTTGVYSYANTLIQRAVPGFVVQGGGYFVDANEQLSQIVGRPAIASEASVKNMRGTLAMALSRGPDTATGEWFFNVADNPELDDTSRGGPFTVFGRAVEDLVTLDRIAGLPQIDLSDDLGDSFENVPLVDNDGTQPVTFQNLVYTNSITPIAVVAKKAGEAGVLKLKANSSNPGVVTAAVSGQKLTLTYVPGATGEATITVKAKNPATMKAAKAKFKVTVQ